MGKSFKPWIILLTHGNWGKELIVSTREVTGEIHNICSFPLFGKMGIEDYIKQIREFLNQISTRAIVVTDLYCGTTTNVALMLSREFNINIITGLNMYLLIQLDEIRNEEPLYQEDDLRGIIKKNTHKCDLISL